MMLDRKQSQTKDNRRAIGPEVDGDGPASQATDAIAPSEAAEETSRGTQRLAFGRPVRQRAVGAALLPSIEPSGP